MVEILARGERLLTFVMSTRSQTILPVSCIHEPASNSAGAQIDLRARVLVVDDSPDLRELIATVLVSQFQINVVGEAGHGLHALELVAELEPDLVLMDVQMPVMNGLVAARLISRNYPEISIILMSGDDSPQLRAEAAASGARTFVHKPRLAAEIAVLLGIV